ncbi:MAG: bactofilin family protein [Candidatus Aminicenantia bacterium]
MERRLSDKIFETVIGKGITISGTIEGEGNISFRGKFKGNISLNGTIFFEGGSDFEGEVYAENLLAEGNLRGKLNIKENVEIRKNAKLEVECICQKISIEEGASFNGKIETEKGETIQPYLFKEKRRENSK